MNTELIYASIIMGLIFLLTIAFAIIIIKTDLLYIKENARWKSGINLPGLDANEGDEVDHKKFKTFMGLNIIALITLIFIGVITFMFVIPHNPTPAEEALYSKWFITILFALILIPMYLMFSDFKERFIKRANSITPRHHKIIFMVLASFLTLLSVVSWVFIS